MWQITFTPYSKNYWGYSEHYREWFYGDLEYSQFGSPTIKRKRSGGKTEWIFVHPNNLLRGGDGFFNKALTFIIWLFRFKLLSLFLNKPKTTNQ